MKNTMLRWLSLVLLTFNVFIANAQDYYEFKDEASGFNVESRQSELEEKATEVALVFDSAGFANQFKVFSFGFYMDLEYYDGYSYPEAFIDMQAQVGQISSSYLLIGRQNDHNGLFQKFIVDLKLPNETPFDCLSTEQRLSLSSKLTSAANQYHVDSPNDFYLAEREVMTTLIWYLNDIISCECHLLSRSVDCETIKPNSILAVDLLADKFVARQIKNIHNSGSNNSGSNIHDYAHFNFEFGIWNPELNSGSGTVTGVIDIADQIKDNKVKIDANGVSGAVYIFNESQVGGAEWQIMQLEISGGALDYVECYVIMRNKLSNDTFSDKGILFSKYFLGEGTGNRGLFPVYDIFKVLGNAAIDASVQMLVNFVLEDNVKNLNDAFHSVNWASAAWAGVSSLIPWKSVASGYKGELIQAAVDGFIYAITELMKDHGKSFYDFGGDFLKGSAISLLSRIFVGPAVSASFNKILKCSTKIWKGISPSLEGQASSTIRLIRGFIGDAAWEFSPFKAFPNLKIGFKSLLGMKSQLKVDSESLETVKGFVTNRTDVTDAADEISESAARLTEAEAPLFLNGLKNGEGPVSQLLITNARRGTPSEIEVATKKINKYRFADKNFGYLEGEVNGIIPNPGPVKGGLWVSGPPQPDVIFIPGTVIWERTTDTEFKMLENFAKKLNAVRGEVYDYTGYLKIVSERTYCASCAGIIHQFNTMFPNVQIILIDGIK